MIGRAFGESANVRVVLDEPQWGKIQIAAFN
jgi:hypothetical protein